MRFIIISTILLMGLLAQSQSISLNYQLGNTYFVVKNGDTSSVNNSPIEVDYSHTLSINYTSKEFFKFSFVGGLGVSTIGFNYETVDGGYWNNYGWNSEDNAEKKKCNQVYISIPTYVQYNIFSTINLMVGVQNEFLVYQSSDAPWDNVTKTYIPYFKFGFNFTLFKAFEIGLYKDWNPVSFAVLDENLKASYSYPPLAGYLTYDRAYSISFAYKIPITKLKHHKVEEDIIHTEPVIVN